MSAVTCACGHLQPFHADVGCRVNGCRCEGFRDPSAPVVEEAPPKSRRMSFDIPEGYMLTVSLIPYTESIPEPLPEDPTDG